MDSPLTAPSRLRAAASGVLAAGAGLAAGEFAAGLARSAASPVVSIGNRVVDAVPQPVKQLAIGLFGTNDKIALVVGILVVLAVLAGAVGLLARHHLHAALAATAGLALVATVAAALDPTAQLPLAVVPGILAGIVAVATLWWLVRRGGVVAAAGGDEHALSRRRFLSAGSGVLVASVAAAGAGRLLGRRFSVAAERAALALPTPAEAARDVPADAHPDVDGLSSFITPNEDFYRIDTALTVPQLSADGWALRIHGMVDDELTLTYRELLDMPSVERMITMTCVSNQVGGDLVGTATWQGVRLADLLDRVGVAPAATQVVGRANDGWTAGFPVEAVAGNEPLVAYGMNGEPLPEVHGFPLRLVTPGLYGYVSATKWLTDVELTTFDAFDQYWVERGWVERAPIKVSSRIDTPGGFDRLTRGDDVAVAGVAWAQTRGIDAVEVRVDDGDFQPAELGAPVGTDTWRQWVYRWDTSEIDTGRHQLTVRAVDGDGTVQAEQRAEPFPSGATGWHNIAVFVDEA